MGTLVKILIVVVVLLVAVAAGIYLTGNTQHVVAQLMKPRHGFDLSRKVPRLDYADPASWAALPDRQDLADLIPAGVAARDAQAAAPVAVFFVHPTTYLHGEEWNDPLAAGTITEENTRWVLANQASAYNGCCDVYAPLYRQATIAAFLEAIDAETREQALEFAYSDVEAAFDHFINQLSRGRPFILASHSQGTRHCRKLLARRISGTPLAERMVAAFLIGGGVLKEELAALPDMHACAHETDVNCVVHWATYGDGGDAPTRWTDEPGTLLCTNPLSWRLGEDRVSSEKNRGAVVPSGRFNIKFWGADRAEGVEFGPLGQPITGHTWAQCRGELLYVEAQLDNDFSAYSMGGERNYHGLDYALFYMDVRENAQRRVAAYLAGN
jgi:hypothetical protein